MIVCYQGSGRRGLFGGIDLGGAVFDGRDILPWFAKGKDVLMSTCQ